MLKMKFWKRIFCSYHIGPCAQIFFFLQITMSHVSYPVSYECHQHICMYERLHLGYLNKNSKTTTQNNMVFHMFMKQWLNIISWIRGHGHKCANVFVTLRTTIFGAPSETFINCAGVWEVVQSAGPSHHNPGIDFCLWLGLDKGRTLVS